MLPIEPGFLVRCDLPPAPLVAAAALDAAVDLPAVTPAGIAGAPATAAGIPTSTIAATAGPSPSPIDHGPARPIAATT